MWDAHMNINLAAPFWCAQAAYNRFGAEGASIINMIDIAALAPEPDYVHYAATKAGLIALTKGLAKSWSPRIRVNGVSPGPVLVPEHYDDEARQEWLDHLPMGEELGPDDVEQTIRLLVDGTRGITGEIITVDGGWTTSVCPFASDGSSLLRHADASWSMPMHKSDRWSGHESVLDNILDRKI